MAEREAMVERLHDAMRARKEAAREYRNAIDEAKTQGWTNTDIARAVGVSEAAIRRYWKRNHQVYT